MTYHPTGGVWVPLGGDQESVNVTEVLKKLRDTGAPGILPVVTVLKKVEFPTFPALDVMMPHP
jgi:hypothetical protein